MDLTLALYLGFCEPTVLIYEKIYLLLNFSVFDFLSLTAKHSLECRQGMMLLISSTIKVTIYYWPHFYKQRHSITCTLVQTAAALCVSNPCVEVS